MSATQTVHVKVVLAGLQRLEVVAHDLGSGSYLSITSGLTMVTLSDRAAAATYCRAWARPVDMVGLLPEGDSPAPLTLMGQIRPKVDADGPSLLITARGTDRARHEFDRMHRTMLIQIGTITWAVQDRRAYHSVALAYTRAAQLADLIFGPRPR